MTLDADGETVTSFDPGQGPVTITLTIDEQTTTTETAAATALVFTLEQDFPGIVTASGTLTLAQTSCEAPVPPAPTASALDPGTGFVPDQTSVSIGEETAPTAQVEVADTGTSLTFTTRQAPPARWRWWSPPAAVRPDGWTSATCRRDR